MFQLGCCCSERERQVIDGHGIMIKSEVGIRRLSGEGILGRLIEEDAGAPQFMWGARDDLNEVFRCWASVSR
jgi:hypothetical protein